MWEWTFPVIGIFVISFVSLASSLLPPFIDRRFPDFKLAETTTFKLATGFAGGIVLAVGFIHTFPEADGDLSEAIGEFPWAGVIALIGAMLTIFVESVLVESIIVRKKKKEGKDIEKGQDRDGHKHGHNHDHNHDHSHAHDFLLDPAQRLTIDMISLLFGFTFHSIFVGFTLGVGDENFALLIAIIVHQLFEGLALGLTVAKVKLKKRRMIVLVDLIYTLSTPLGIVAGILVRKFVGGESTTVQIIIGVANALSAGILIFVGLHHLIIEGYKKSSGRIMFQIMLTASIGFGAAAMGVLAIWA